MRNRRKQLAPGEGLVVGGTIVVFVCLLLMAVFSIVSWPPWADAELDRHGVLATGEVLGEPEVISSRNRTPNRVRLRVRLVGAPRPGELITLTARPAPHLVDGASVEVELLADDLDVARLRADRYGIFGLDTLAWMGVGPVIGLVLILLGRLRRARAG